MQNLPLPNILLLEIFYIGQVGIYAFCVTNLKDNFFRIYMYSEGTAKKGGNEVCSFIMNYIKEYVPEKTRTLYLFSNRCSVRNNTFIRCCKI